MPDDDPDRLLRRTRVDYPIAHRPRARARRDPHHAPAARARHGPARCARTTWRCRGCTGAGSSCPHGTLAYLLVRHPEQFPRSAMLHGRARSTSGSSSTGPCPPRRPGTPRESGRMEPVRRIMVETGERFWGRLWRPLYDGLEGNPFAAMPSLHFGTSVMAARVLSDVGQGPGRARLDLRAHAGLRARLPGRALRGRPGGGAGPGRGGAARRAARAARAGRGRAAGPAARAGTA